MFSKQSRISILLFTISVSFFICGCVIQEGDDENEVVISSECVWSAGAECSLDCEALEFWVACEAELEVTDCAPVCNIDLTAECHADCSAACSGECEANPGVFDCNAYCEGNCGANCNAECAASSNAAECQARCSAFCNGECSAECEVDLPELDCNGHCNASCNGECSAEANIDCHLCQVDFHAQCEADLKVECRTGCETEGMLECNGEFISSSDLYDAAVWVRDNIDATIDAEGYAECEGNTCKAGGSCSAECAIGKKQPGSSNGMYGVLFFLAAIGLFFVYRRR